MKVGPLLIHRLFYPQVPAVLSTQHGGKVSAMPVVSYASVSDLPPLVAVACNPRSFTCKLALKASSFSLCILDGHHAGAVAKLATTSGSKVKDKLLDAGLSHRPGSKLKVPVIRGADATLECRLKDHWKLGDHTLLVGQVEAASASGAFKEFWDYEKYHPLLYTGWREGLTTLPGV
ncbi:MAG: flavin reductase family protein [Thaumarchaeota archaeon]|nr:flavin reductase family protein [Nitrososphaerota archaeon]